MGWEGGDASGLPDPLPPGGATIVPVAAARQHVPDRPAMTQIIAAPTGRMRLGPVRVGGDNPVRIMGVINASPESFYRGSVRESGRGIREAARRMEEEGADVIDVGGMSTAPYLRTAVPERTELGRVVGAVKAVQAASNLPVSVDTCRSGVAGAAMDLGAAILNDVSGLKRDPLMPRVLGPRGSASAVLCAFGAAPSAGDPVARARGLLMESVALAEGSGVDRGSLVLDPAVGFFRRTGGGGPFTRIPGDWFERDLAVVRNLRRIKRGFPLMVSVSNKSFVGRLFGVRDPADRVPYSVAVEAACVLNGADVVRTHNVAETRIAVRAAAAALGRAR